MDFFGDRYRYWGVKKSDIDISVDIVCVYYSIVPVTSHSYVQTFD